MYGCRDIRVWTFTTPGHPWATPNSSGVLPHTSTPLPPGRPKLSQRRPQIWGHFWPCSSRLGATAPALFRSLFRALRSCYRDALLFGMLLASYRGQHCSPPLVQLFICSCHMTCPLIMWPTKMAATIAPSLGQIVNLRILILSFFFFVFDVNRQSLLC